MKKNTRAFAAAFTLAFTVTFALLAIPACSGDMSETEEHALVTKSETVETYDNNLRDIDGNKIDDSFFEEIPDTEGLVYDTNTGIVYYLFKQPQSFGNKGYGFMSPYLGEDGYPCKYVDGEIVELEA